jgi:RES domain-containing protein
MASDSIDWFEATTFRHVSPGHEELSEEVLSGSLRAGGRFNPRGDFGAIYVSLEKETVVAELKRRATQTGIEVDELLPRLLLVVKAELQQVLDLTDEENRRRWSLSSKEIISDEYRTCQEVGRAARKAGYEAVLFPSAAREGGRNLAVFTDRLRPGSTLEVTEKESLTLDD